MVDIAVPSDIDPKVGELPDVFLYTIDDLQEVVAEGQRNRQAAAREAMDIIDRQVDQFMGWLETLAAGSYIRDMRAGAAGLRDAVLEQGRRRLAAGDSPEAVMAFRGQHAYQQADARPHSGHT